MISFEIWQDSFYEWCIWFLGNLSSMSANPADSYLYNGFFNESKLISQMMLACLTLQETDKEILHKSNWWCNNFEN